MKNQEFSMAFHHQVAFSWYFTEINCWPWLPWEPPALWFCLKIGCLMAPLQWFLIIFPKWKSDAAVFGDIPIYPIFRHTHTTDSNVCPHVFVGHVPFSSFSIVGYILRLKTDYGHTIGHGCHLLLSSRTFILPILSWNPSILYIMLLYFAR